MSVITKDGEPWPWEVIPMPGGHPNKFWVEFPAIFPGEVLGVHRVLRWAATSDNRTWGDGVDSSGNIVDESFIQVIEYPTPEPASVSLLAIGLIGLLACRRRRAFDPAVQRSGAWPFVETDAHHP